MNYERETKDNGASFMLLLIAVVGHFYALWKWPKAYWQTLKWLLLFWAVSAALVALEKVLSFIGLGGWLYSLLNSDIVSISFFAISMIGFIAVPFIAIYKGKQADWCSWPSMDDYATANSVQPMHGKLTCVGCGSLSIKNIGFDGRQDTRRMHICNQCSKVLYRTQTT